MPGRGTRDADWPVAMTTVQALLTANVMFGVPGALRLL